MKLTSVLLAASLALLTSSAFSQSVSGTATTDPVGYLKINCLTNSDTMVGLPFTRPPVFVGTVASVSGSTITISGTTGWSVGQFAFSGTQTNTYFVQINTHPTNNAKEGRIYPVTGNTASAITVDLNGDTLDSVASSTPVQIIPYWTLGTLFPASDANVSFTPSASTLSIKTQVLVPDYSGTGINRAANKTYYYLSSGTNIGWRLSGDLTTKDHSNDILLPDGYLIVRNKNNAPTLPLVISGAVSGKKVTTPLDTLPAGKQDNPVALIRPVDLTVSQLGLDPASGNFVASPSTLSIKDQILIFDNAATGMNKAASKSYYYISSGTNVGWRLSGAPSTENHGSDIIPAGNAMIIRKANTAGGQTTFWQNSPTY